MKKLGFAAMAIIFLLCGCASEGLSTSEKSVISSESAQSDIEIGTGLSDKENSNFEESEIETGFEGEELISDEFKSLMSDYVNAVFYNAYGRTYRILGYDYDIKSTETNGNIRKVYFSLDFRYKNNGDPDTVYYIKEAKENNSSEYKKLYEQYSEQKNVISFFCIEAEESEGRVMPETFMLLYDSSGIVPEKSNFTSAEKMFPVVNDYFGTISIDKVGQSNIFNISDYRITIDRKLWVKENGGYTENGYFITDFGSKYTFPISSLTEVKYMIDSYTADNMDIKTFIELNDVENKIYYVTVKNDVVTYILEAQKP